MRILLTGGNGFLGKIISNYLSKDELYTLGLSTNSTIFCDITKPIFSLPKVDICIHSAGKAHLVPKSFLDKQSFFDINFKGTQNLLHGIENSHFMPKSFIFISSVSVYGRETGNNIDEDAPLLAKDPYGLSKIQAENFVLGWCKQHNVVCTILRLPLLVGANPPGNLGAMIKGIRNGYYFNIAGGKAKKSMVLADDVAKSILKVSEIGGIYNLTDGYHPSFSEISNNFSFHLGKKKPNSLPMWLANLIAKFGDIIGNKAPLNTHKLKKITSDLTFDDSKARKAFGWNPSPVVDFFKIQQDA